MGRPRPDLSLPGHSLPLHQQSRFRRVAERKRVCLHIQSSILQPRPAGRCETRARGVGQPIQAQRAFPKKHQFPFGSAERIERRRLATHRPCARRKQGSKRARSRSRSIGISQTEGKREEEEERERGRQGKQPLPSFLSLRSSALTFQCARLPPGRHVRERERETAAFAFLFSSSPPRV